MVYELSSRQIKKEMEKLEVLARENLYINDLEGFVFDSADSLYHRTCMLAKKIKVPPEDSHIIRAENSYNCAKNMRTSNKITAIYGLIWATSELEKAMIEEIVDDGKGNLKKIKLSSLDLSVMAFIEDFPGYNIDGISECTLISKESVEESLLRLKKMGYIEEDKGKFY